MACLMIGTSILVSCNDEMANVISPEEEIRNEIKPEYVTLSFNVSADEAASRTSYEESNNDIIAKWSQDDCIYVGTPAAGLSEAVSIDAYNSGFTKLENPTISYDGKTATFSGTVAVTTGSKIMAFYCKEPKMLEVTSSGVKMNFELAQSVSEINDLSQYDLMSAIADYPNETESINLNFVHECAILKVNATGIEADAPVRELELTLPDGAGFYNTITIGKDGSKVYSDVKNTFSVQLNDAVATDGKLGAYCMVVTDGITSGTNLEIKAIVNKPSGDYTYTNTMGVPSNIQKGKFYYTKERAMTLDGSIKELNGYKLIDNVDKFKTIDSDASSNYILIRDLDFTGIDFTPIPTFSGTFEGKGNTLSNITLNITDGNGGIFAVNEGTIQNLTVEGATVTKTGSLDNNGGTAILAGVNNNKISNCIINSSSLNASLSSKGTDVGIGLLVGINNSGKTISECTVDASSLSVSGSNNAHIGGLVGYNLTGNIEFSFVKSATNITYTSTADGANIGGLIGRNKGGTIKGCSTNIDIDTSEPDVALKIAGFIGDAFYASATTIEGCYTTGNLTFRTKQTYGGFAGSLAGAGEKTLTNCYTSLNFYGATDHAFVSAGENSNTYLNVTASNIRYVKGTQADTKNDNINTDSENIKSATAEELKNMVKTFNNPGWTDYEFVAGTDDEPLIIQKKQQ